MTRNAQYDIFGNRVEVDATVGETTTITRFAYDMWNPAKAGATGTSGSDIWATFTSGGSLTMRELQGDGIDQHLAYVTSSSAYWYLTDHLSSIRAVLDSSGGVTASVAYDAYGNLTTAAAPGLYDWTGREFDVETGLQYNRARYYDPGTGRWISQDPLGFDAGDSNLSRYVQNNPATEEDPGGLIGGPPARNRWPDGDILSFPGDPTAGRPGGPPAWPGSAPSTEPTPLIPPGAKITVSPMWPNVPESPGLRLSDLGGPSRPRARPLGIMEKLLGPSADEILSQVRPVTLGQLVFSTTMEPTPGDPIQYIGTFSIVGENAKKANGFVVQHVIQKLNGRPLDTFWEAWQVIDGSVFAGYKKTPNIDHAKLGGRDIFGMRNVFGVGGLQNGDSIDMIGYAKFVPGLELNWPLGRDAGIPSDVLPATRTRPDWWQDDKGTIQHALNI